ncbi:hypothetical protein ACFSKI_11270 [Pseudogracilibacillus auburnensis]|uniref:Uncharacterized protein n=1 Tax=Pseudogracilibacillus auburnensis TaxID=1494959 RepID=A0A2V3VRA2_9BACI|nr:hypothetical protein [Pseudogracilibacillus auburnensis]MBO1001863.1 hypothetical protein [Pseudogracilibacillus auburnensis]PXW83351.1 hypothetical protein DFR56_11630 [Pseudogracilibacillus auburnensis]
MRRPLLHSKTNTQLSSRTESRTKVEYTGLALEKRLRQKRSLNYVNGFTQLDAGTVTCNHTEIDELIQKIKNEFSDLQPYHYPIGIIAKCYLGDDFIVHTLDTRLEIVKHYKKGEALPSEMDRGKSLALHPSYEFIEVYSDTLRAVSSNGNVAIIKR